MTVQSEVSRSGPYAGAGTTGPFTVGFRFLADSHLRVIRTSAAGVDTDLVLTTDYSVTGAGNDTGTVTLVVALPIGASLTIIRDVPFTQEADYVDNDAFPAESHETALDKLTMQTQQIREAQDRSLTLSPTSDGVSAELPSPIASNILGWNSSGTGFVNYDPAGLAGIISYGSFRVDVFNGNGTAVDFPLTGDALVAANCDVVVGGVSQTPDVNYEYLPATKTVRFKTGAPPAGTANVFVRYGSVLDVGYASAIDGQTAVGTALIKAADAAAARAAIDAAGLGSGDTFTVSPLVPNLSLGDITGKAANAKFVADSIAALVVPSVRQTVLSGPVDTNGYAAFGGSTGSATVTASGTLRLTSSNGDVNHTWTRVNPSWTGLSVNGTMYLYDDETDGQVASTLAPTYRFGGADVVTNGQFTYNRQESVAKVGNGTTAVQKYRVCVGEVIVAGGVVTSIIWYALKGKYFSGYTNTLPGASTSISKSNNIGCEPSFYKSNITLKNLVTAAGFAVGDIATNLGQNNTAYAGPIAIKHTRLLSAFATANAANPWSLIPAAGGNYVTLTRTDWSYGIETSRGW